MSAAAADQRCAWPGCAVTARRGRGLCAACAARLPARMRRELPAGAPPDEVLAFMRRVYAEDAAAAERAADLRRRQEVLF